MELAKGIIIPVVADFVLSPEVVYSDELTAIYFETEDEQFGRITFENLDAIKICRGEILPYKDDWDNEQDFPWVYKIEHSEWLKERFNYENKHYGSTYEFGGNVKEMLTDFSHYLFKFHDQFMEVTARGFWFEKSETSLFKKELQSDHPFLNLPENNAKRFSAHGLTTHITTNPKSEEQLINDAQFCSQKLLQFALELEGRCYVDHTLLLSHRNGELISRLTGYFGSKKVEFNGIATCEDVLPYIENHMLEVAERRKKMGK